MTDSMTQTNPTTPPLLEISTHRAIALARRWRWISIVLQFGLLLILGGAVYAFEQGGGYVVFALLFVLWTVVASLSARTRKLAFDAGQYIAAGEFDLAEDRLTQSLTSFTLAGSSKQIGLQQLAMLRHAQSRWSDAAALARAFLAGRGRLAARDIQSRLVLAESLLEMGDLDGVAREIFDLSRQRLNLRQTLVLTQLRLDYLARRGDFQQMFQKPQTVLSLIELMPASISMRCHALLALAAKRLEQTTWWHFLAGRAKLLGDIESLLEARPFLQEVFETSGPATV